MAYEARILLAGLSALLLVLTSSGANVCQEQNDPTYFHVDIFEEVLSNHTDVARQLSDAPFVRGQESDAPAFQFSGRGFDISGSHLTNTIKRLSCLVNEVTIYGSVYLRDSHSGGPLVVISYTGDREKPLWGLYLDALKDELTVVYRHQGRDRSEIFNLRLHGGKWHRYAVTFSGNLVRVFLNCEEVASRVVALPDYCSNEDAILVTVVDSASASSTGLIVYLQRVAFRFGRGGVQQQCPEAPEDCPSCGQFLTVVEKVFQLRRDVTVLETRVDRLMEGNLPVENEEETEVPPLPMQSCLVDRRRITIAEGTFRRFLDSANDNKDTLCYCRDGTPTCYVLPVCDAPSDAPTTTPAPGVFCTRTDGRQFSLNDMDFTYELEMENCQVDTCTDIGLGKPTLIPTNTVSCSERSAEIGMCNSSFSEYDQNLAKCCRHCSVCDFASCPAGSSCQRDNSLEEYFCSCDNGYEEGDTGRCVDRNECSVGQRQGGHNCPERSVCINTPGGFNCSCNLGFRMEISSQGFKSCVDIDECLTHTCPMQSDCMNSVGSYSCRCQTGYNMVDDECLPVCDPPCANGGQCDSPSQCLCPVGFTGASCEVDIDECKDDERCEGDAALCVNTFGSFRCRCLQGYNGNGTHCEDVDECAMDSNINNCIGSSRCQNTMGSFRCICDRGVDCTGACVRSGVQFLNHESILVGTDLCRNCTCIDGEYTCRPRICDCSLVGVDPTFNRQCCPDCYRQVCRIKSGRTEVIVRSGQVWIDPTDRCQKCTCVPGPGLGVGSAKLQCEDMSKQCPTLSCAAELQYTPSGQCCPACEVPPCDESHLGKQRTLQRGCKTCTCSRHGASGSFFLWNCVDKVVCDSSTTCSDQEILFLQDGCCPVCEREALGIESC